MARTVKEYDERYNEFLNIGQRLFYQKGYAQTSVQDIIGEMGVAKGLFYYYFPSKTDLLDAIVERIGREALVALEPMIEDATLDAPTKLEQFFTQTQNWKLANREFLLDVMAVVYRDENTVLRMKIIEAMMPIVVPHLASILRQGVAEGVYSVEYPEECAEIVLEMTQGLASPIVKLLLHRPGNGETMAAALQTLERRVRACERSIERVLGAAEGSISLLSSEQLRTWFA